MPPAFAADGNELPRALHARPGSKVPTGEPRVLRGRATDADDAVGTVRLSAQPPQTERGGEADADREVTGPAAPLSLSLWNRLPYPAAGGDTAPARSWRERPAGT
ncbi:hypothetical protein [Streptomyces sp. NPDC088766]|uniref:hypothetical protein n=1 Tax=Streptomyces sp. NPDC088766 TaxID=3365893 RepID=UPI0037FC4DAB